MAEHELKLKATIDTSQVQSQLNSLGKSAGSGVEVNTQKIDQAFSKLAQSLNRLTAEMEKAARNANMTGRSLSNAAKSGAGLGVNTFLKGAGRAGIAYGIGAIGSSMANYYDASGQKETAKTINQVSSGATNVLGGAAAGAAVGSVVPVIGTAVGAAVGAVVGGIKTAFEVLADRARDAAEALEAISNFKSAMGGIVESNTQRNQLKIATSGPSEARDKLFDQASKAAKDAEAEANRLAGIAKHNEEILATRKDISEAEKKALQGVVDAYKKAVNSLNHNQKIVDTINNAKKSEADKAKQEADRKAKEQRELENWKSTQSAQTSRAQADLATSYLIDTFGTASDETLKENAENSKKIVDEGNKKLAELLQQRAEAIEKGDKDTVASLDRSIDSLENAIKNNEQIAKSAEDEIKKREAKTKQSESFARGFGRKEEMETFEASLKGSSMASLKQQLHDLNIDKMIQREQIKQSNEAGDFETRDKLVGDLSETEAKMKMLKDSIDKIKSADLWAGAGQMSEMAKVGMYMSKADQGMNDPKLQAQKEGNELLKQIKENTANQNYGLE